MVKHTKVITRVIINMVKVNIHIKMEVCMKGAGKKIRNMGMGYKFGLQDKGMKDSGQMVCTMDRG